MFLPEQITNWPLTSYIYTIPYLLLGIVVLILYKNQIFKGVPISHYKTNLFVCILFLLFFGLRWHIMTDTLAYEEEYYTFTTNFNWEYIEVHSWWWDKGFVIFAMLCKLITPDFFFFVFANTLVDIILFALCLKKFDINIPIAIFAFLAFQGILMEINTMRNIKAVLLFVYSISYIEDRKLFKFLLINFVGFTFHSSALLFFPMYWILGKKYNIKILFIAMSIITFIYLANINILQNYLMSLALSDDNVSVAKFTQYLSESDEQTLSLGFIERLLTLFLIMRVYKKLGKSSQNLIVANAFFVFYVLYAIFGFNFVFRDRIPYLFVFSYWLIYPYLFDYYGKKRMLFKAAFIFLFIGKIFLSTHICSAYYETVLFHETTRAQRQYLNDRFNN